jgi:hypothetical protein
VTNDHCHCLVRVIPIYPIPPLGARSASLIFPSLSTTKSHCFQSSSCCFIDTVGLHSKLAYCELTFSPPNSRPSRSCDDASEHSHGYLLCHWETGIQRLQPRHTGMSYVYGFSLLNPKHSSTSPSLHFFPLLFNREPLFVLGLHTRRATYQVEGTVPG